MVSLNEEEWPESWKTVEFKEYPRMPQTPLPEPQDLTIQFGDLLKKRSSKRDFDNTQSLSLQTLSNILHWGAGLRLNKKRPQHSFRFYASGGARYPLEVYISFVGNKDIAQGIYHYNVKLHTLEKIGGAKEDTRVRELWNYPWVKDASAIVFITGMFERTIRKYRERGYRFVHLDAGALLQNFYLVSEACGVGCSAVGTIIDDEISNIFDLDEREDFIIHLATGHLKK